MKILNQLKKVVMQQRYTLIVMLGVATGVAGLTVISQKKTRVIAPVPVVVANNNDEATKILASQLNDIQVQLSNLQREIKKPQKTVNLEPIKNELNKLSHVIESAKVNGDGTAKRLIGENRQLVERVELVSNTLEKINLSQQPIKYLDGKSLPFKVIAIDNIQEQSVAAIEYNFHPIALEKGDEIAGWKVIGLDYAKQLVEFENHDKAHVQLSLTQIG